ncbi:MAG: hypothetical protein QOI95_1973 [Acidimicrobiaceae bacterium]|jgi:uncharacterized protein (TIGR03083 family)
MEPAEIYAACRARLLGIAPSLSGEQLDAPLAATPPWTVLDGYRHLAGVCADFLDGRLEGAGTPDWTAAQLAARATGTIDDVCEEWASRGPELDARLEAGGEALAFLVFDVWTHEQDIRAAVGRAGVRDDEHVPALASLALTTFGPRYAGGGAPTISVIVDGEPRSLGEGEPAATLDTTAYELLRIIFGRRSEAQINGAGWSGDCAKPIRAIHLFDPPQQDITD